MADPIPGPELNLPILKLTPEEKRVFGRLFAEADREQLGVVTGDVAVKFFERTGLAAPVLGRIWQIADVENRGLLTSAGFCQVLRLIGHYQAGMEPTSDLAFTPGPLPRFNGTDVPASTTPAPLSGIQPQVSGGPIRVPPLSPEKATEYALMFEKSGAQNGLLSGESAKYIFDNTKLPNDILGHIWNLADTEQRGALGVTEFIIAMHLLFSYKSGAMKALPSKLPAGLYEAASRRTSTTARLPTSSVIPRPNDPSSIPRQYSGNSSQRTQSPLGRAQFVTQPINNEWLITPKDKTSYDDLFNKVDTERHGYITGEQAVSFFNDSGLPEDTLAAIWDLADMNSRGQLNRDEFAVAMYLIRQQRRPGVSLPSVLPPNLVPPSMRNQAKPSVTAPETTSFTSNVSKSASEDLFGLDAFTPATPSQTQQSTGGSAAYAKPYETDPFGSKPTSPTASQTFQSSPRGQPSTFKPFIPTSAFGQNLTSQSTGASGTSSLAQSRTGVPSAVDDLLGDNDPEVSKKLTQETAELANMSNQIGTLKSQMQEIQKNKSVTETELSTANSQKRELELRLAQFRTQYEQEVQHVKALEERLASSRNETRKLQQDFTVVENSYHEVQTQHRQLSSALEADQRENGSLKERIRIMNAEIHQLRPQLEKMKSDARQQKGLVAINKKQLATNEGERDKIKKEMDELTKASQDSASPPEHGSTVPSPPLSTTSHSSTNPFFRKSPQPPTENTMSPSGFSRDSNQAHGRKDFDSMFGSPFPPPSGNAPQTSFKSDAPIPTFSTQSGPSVRSSEPDVPTPSTSPPLSSYHESPRANDLPAPPESRQFASSFLPLRDGVPRTDSFSSSVKVSTPASRYGTTGHDTPTLPGGSPAATPIQEKEANRSFERADTAKSGSNNFGVSPFDRNTTASPATSAIGESAQQGGKNEDTRDPFSGFSPASASRDIPGAFPSDVNSPLQTNPTGDSALSEQSKGSNRVAEGFQTIRTDPFSVPREQPRGGGATSKVDFDAAFADFASGRQPQEKQHTGSTANGSGDSAAASRFNQEFPPIEDLGRDDESDSTSEQGFADNFTTASPRQISERAKQGQGAVLSAPIAVADDLEEGSNDIFRPRPSTSQAGSTTGVSGGAGAPKPLTTFDPTFSNQPGSRSGHRGTNQYASEFGGPLPPRQDINTGSQGSQSPEMTVSVSGPVSSTQGQALFGSSAPKSTSTSPVLAYSQSTGDQPAPIGPSDSYHSAVSFPSATDKGPSPPIQSTIASKSPFNHDFDTGFEDLAEAKESDEKAEEEYMLDSHHREGFDEFNPVFDSPAASKSNTMASQHTPTGKGSHGEDSFQEFEHLSQAFVGPNRPPQQATASTSQDWDAIFSNLDNNQSDKTSPEHHGDIGKTPFAAHDEPSALSTKDPQPPQLGRALSAGTEHDDPILKKLTGMGYPRADALAALEKYDYDITKAANYLASAQ